MGVFGFPMLPLACWLLSFFEIRNIRNMFASAPGLILTLSCQGKQISGDFIHNFSALQELYS